VFDDRIDLKLLQADVERAYGADLPPAYRAVELDRITGGSDRRRSRPLRRPDDNDRLYQGELRRLPAACRRLATNL
jgi:hypothetical protein